MKGMREHCRAHRMCFLSPPELITYVTCMHLISTPGPSPVYEGPYYLPSERKRHVHFNKESHDWLNTPVFQNPQGRETVFTSSLPQSAEYVSYDALVPRPSQFFLE